MRPHRVFCVFLTGGRQNARLAPTATARSILPHSANCQVLRAPGHAPNRVSAELIDAGCSLAPGGSLLGAARALRATSPGGISMIDATTERLLTLSEAAAICPKRRRGRPTHVASIYR